PVRAPARCEGPGLPKIPAAKRPPATATSTSAAAPVSTRRRSATREARSAGGDPSGAAFASWDHEEDQALGRASPSDKGGSGPRSSPRPRSDRSSRAAGPAPIRAKSGGGSAGAGG